MRESEPLPADVVLDLVHEDRPVIATTPVDQQDAEIPARMTVGLGNNPCLPVRAGQTECLNKKNMP